MTAAAATARLAAPPDEQAARAAATCAAEKLAPALRAINRAPEGSSVRSSAGPVLEALAIALKEAGLPAALTGQVMAACLIDGMPVVIAIEEARRTAATQGGTR